MAERLVQPLLQWTWLTFLPLRLAERSPRPSLAAANGQLIAVRRSAYEAAGGHRAVRDQIVEDVALLRAVKRSGGRGTVVDGTAVASCRMYDGGRALADGYTKSLSSAFGSPAGAGAVMGALIAVYVVPPAAALRGSRTGLVGYLAGVAGRAVSARRTGGASLARRLPAPPVRAGPGRSHRSFGTGPASGQADVEGPHAVSRVVVIGAGVGGLACAARLAALGHDVTVCEMSEQIGGKLGRLTAARVYLRHRALTGDDAAGVPRALQQHR